MIENKPVLYGIAPYNRNGCHFYRVYQPFKKIQEIDLYPSAMSSELELADQEVWLNQCDVVFTQTGFSEKYLQYIIDNKDKKKFVFDYDDNLFEVSPYNPAYSSFGLSEVEYDIGFGKKAYLRNGECGFDIERNKKRIQIFTEILKHSHMVTTPSRILAGEFAGFNRNVNVIKNFIDFEQWSPVNIQKDEWIRIVWQGGFSHFEDWFEVREPLLKIMGKHKNVRLVVMGEKFGGLLAGFDENRVDFHKWIDILAYPHKFKTLNGDIGLIPLKNNKFNRCKSEIKWEEYSAIGLPSIASNVPPYSNYIKHNETGFLASNKDEWYNYMEILISDRKRRRELGQTAYEFVKKNYDLETGVMDYKGAFDSLFKMELVAV